MSRTNANSTIYLGWIAVQVNACLQLEERLTMDMTDDDARDHIFALLDQSVNHIMARLGDDAHRIASQLR